MSLTVLQSKRTSKRVVLVDLGYPYGKKIYMSGSVVSVAAQLITAGHKVEIVDFNIDNAKDDRVREKFSSAEVIGASVMGSPGIPLAVEFIEKISRQYPSAQILLGGQVISRFSPEQFHEVFGPMAAQITNDRDLTCFFGLLSSAYEIPYQPVWEQMGDARLKRYLSHEFALVFSQGCIYECAFCSAQKGQKENFRNLSAFRGDLRYLLQKAKQFGFEKIECYASSLDFFQTPKMIFEFLETMAETQEEAKTKL